MHLMDLAIDTFHFKVYPIRLDDLKKARVDPIKVEII